MSVPVQSGQYPGGNGSPIYTFYANLGKTMPVIDGATAGITANGVIDDGPALRAILAEFAAVGCGQLRLPPGVVYLGQGANAENGTYQAGGFVPGGVTIVGAGIGATTLRLANGSAQSSHVLMNWHIQSGGDQNITLANLTIDGNAANQSMPAGTSGQGLKVLRVRNLRCFNVQFLNVYGTAAGSGGEGFHASFDLSTDALFVGCEALGTTANTASGFSANDSTNVQYIGCTARGMGFGNGFTHNTCAGVSHLNCFSYLNANFGFNSEVSNDVRYTQCRAGGLAVNAGSYPYTPGQSLGNTGSGFVANQSAGVVWTGCQSSYNGGNGLNQSNVISGSGNQWIGGEISHNTSLGISGGMGDTLKIGADAFIVGNNGVSANQIHSGGSDHPAYGALAAPAIPASGAAFLNPFCVPCLVWVNGGTVSNVSVQGGQVASATGVAVSVPAGGTITITYTAAPAWAWTSIL